MATSGPKLMKVFLENNQPNQPNQMAFDDFHIDNFEYKNQLYRMDVRYEYEILKQKGEYKVELIGYEITNIINVKPNGLKLVNKNTELYDDLLDVIYPIVIKDCSELF